MRPLDHQAQNDVSVPEEAKMFSCEPYAYYPSPLLENKERRIRYLSAIVCSLYLYNGKCELSKTTIML